MKKSLLVVLMSMVLGACGSGTSGTNLDLANNGGLIKEPRAIDIVPTPAIPAVDSIRDEDIKNEVITKKNQFFSDTSVDGLDAAALPEGVMTKEIGGKTFRILNLPYSIALWDVYDYGYDINSFETFQGSPIEENMSTHKVTYNGYSASLDVAGRMHLDVDFANKTLSGKLYERRNKNSEMLPDIVLKEATHYDSSYIFKGKTDYIPMRKLIA